VDHTQCGTADSTSFPVSVVETRVGFKSVANGGSVTSASGYDIAFYSDAGLTTLLDFEIESWSATTGALVAHVPYPDSLTYVEYRLLSRLRQVIDHDGPVEPDGDVERQLRRRLPLRIGDGRLPAGERAGAAAGCDDERQHPR
jgi:hypothetical protein